MNEEKFWELIQDAAKQSDGVMDVKCERVKVAINHLSIEDAKIFSGIFDDKMDRAYSWPLWGAAYVMGGGCSDDTFIDFRSSLISRGKEKFDEALSNPDSLASEEFDEDAWFFEGFQYAVAESVESVIGAALPRNSPHPKDPSGTPWDEDSDELKAKYPKLWIAFEDNWSAPEQSFSPESKPWWKFW